MSAGSGRPFVWLGVMFGLIVLFAAAPFISVLIASGIAGILGCSVNEGGASGCMFMGTDIGETLAEMFVAGWLMFVTFPIGVMALMVWLLVLCVVVVVRWRRSGRIA